MTCTLFGQVNIYLNGSIEVVLEGELELKLKGLIDIKKQAMQNIYQSGIINDPSLEGTIETVLNLEGCLISDEDPPIPTPTPSLAPPGPIECQDNVIVNSSGAAKLFKFEIQLGSGVGVYGIDWFMGGYIPDRFVVLWDSNIVIDTGWVGPTNSYPVPTGTFTYNVYDNYTYNAPYINFGPSSGTESVTITSSNINIGAGTTGIETFNKTNSTPTTIDVWVYSHPTNNSTVWSIEPLCSVETSNTPTPSITPTVTPSYEPKYAVWVASPCCGGQSVFFNVDENQNPLQNTSFFYDGICWDLIEPYSLGFSNTNINILYDDCTECQNINGVSCVSNTATPTQTVTPSTTPTVTPTNTVTPTVTPTITPSTSISLDYFSAPTLCCDSTDTPITGNIAISPSYLLDSGDITILNGHAYTLGTKQPAVGDETYITDVVGDFSTCEQAISYAVYLSGTTSGCRYTFSACCGVDSLVYVDPFSIQGANPSSYAVINSWILNAPYTIINTSGIINECVTLNDFNSSISIDNTELTNYNLIDDGYECGENRCSRCMYVVEPCSDPGTYLRWVINPNSSYDYEVGDVFSGSNINGYQVSSSTYEITGHCLTIVDNTSTPIVGGAVYTVNEGFSPGSQQYGTHTSIGSNGCNSPLLCPECATNFTLQNNSVYVRTVTYNLCDGTPDSTTLPEGAKGSPTTVTVTDCVDMSTIVLDTGTVIQTSFDYCE